MPQYTAVTEVPGCVMFQCSDVSVFVQFKVWLKSAAEQSFLYGHHVMKSGLGRITENTDQYQGIIVYNMADVPLVSRASSRLSV